MDYSKQTVKKHAYISSTATGYDCIVYVLFEGNKERSRVYKNISASSMERFYNVSNSWSDTYRIKHVPWHWFRKVRHGG